MLKMPSKPSIFKNALAFLKMGGQAFLIFFLSAWVFLKMPTCFESTAKHRVQELRPHRRRTTSRRNSAKPATLSLGGRATTPLQRILRESYGGFAVTSGHNISLVGFLEHKQSTHEIGFQL